MGNIALVTFGIGLLCNVIVAALYYYFIRHKCTGLSCIANMSTDIIFIIACQIYWIIYSLFMNKQCPGLGHLILFYYIINVVHYNVANHLMMRKARQLTQKINVKIQNIRQQERRVYNKYSDVLKEQPNETERIDEEHNDLIKQRSEVKSRFEKHLMYSSAFYLVVFILVLAFYKCKSE